MYESHENFSSMHICVSGCDTGEYIESSRPNSSIAIRVRLQRSRAYVLAVVTGSPGYDDYEGAVGAAIADCSRVINFVPVVFDSPGFQLKINMG